MEKKMKVLNMFVSIAMLATLSACAGGPGTTIGGGGSSGGHGVKAVAVDSTGTPILVGDEDLTHGGTSDGGTPMIDNGGTGPYVPAPVTQTEQDHPVVVHDDPAPTPPPAPEPTNADFGTDSE